VVQSDNATVTEPQPYRQQRRREGVQEGAEAAHRQHDPRRAGGEHA
jgi:hypothetical protein